MAALRRSSSILPVLLLPVLMAACDDGLSPLQVGGEQPVAALEPIGLALDADFGTNGRIELSYLARDNAGDLLRAGNVRVQASLVAEDSCYDVTILEGFRRPSVGDRIEAALILDSSGSMASSDGQRLRVPAAEGFAAAVLGANGNNRVAVFDFGPRSTSPFRYSRMLADLSPDLDSVRTGLERVVASGGTPMYGSVLEVLDFMDASVAPGATPIGVVLGDGQPSSAGGTLQNVIDAANGFSIQLFTIGLGPAAVDVAGGASNAVEIMQDMAAFTGGAYASLSGADALEQRFQALATGLAMGYHVTRLRLDPVPSARERVEIRLGNGRGADALWVLQVPARSGAGGPGCPS